jgi:SAM-dependent methyltransferase
MIILWWLLTLLGVSFLLIVFRGAPYVPTHQKDISKLFDIYRFKTTDLLVDLGSGDGRVLAEAARRNVKAVGYELNPFLALLSRYKTRHLSPKPKIVVGDFWMQSLPDDTAVVFVFLAKPFMEKLDRKLSSEAARLGHDLILVSYGMKIPSRSPERIEGAMVVYRYSA